MTEEPAFEIEKGTFSLRLTGSPAIVQISQYAADAIGVIGEPLGVLKDSLKSYRINKAESVAIALQRARMIREQQQKSIGPVSQKYLANWIEGASSEDANGPNILELWARLLASSNLEFDSKLLAYNDVLRKIGPLEAKLISTLLRPNNLCGLISREDGMRRYTTSDDCKIRSKEVANLAANYLAGFLNDQLEPSTFSRNHKRLHGCRLLINSAMSGKCIKLSVSNGASGLGVGSTEGFDVLEHAGVIVIDRVRVTQGDIRVEVDYCWPTSIGLGMYETVNQEKLMIPKDQSLDDLDFSNRASIRARIPKPLLKSIEPYIDDASSESSIF
tara:strand:- start:918 stop:1907 length:990 start_codon:yes stop_codon:yes gene_type:complete